MTSRSHPAFLSAGAKYPPALDAPKVPVAGERKTTQQRPLQGPRHLELVAHEHSVGELEHEQAGAPDAAAADEAVRCVVITGAGRAFSAGHGLSDPAAALNLQAGASQPDIGDLIDLSGLANVNPWGPDFGVRGLTGVRPSQPPSDSR